MPSRISRKRDDLLAPLTAKLPGKTFICLRRTPSVIECHCLALRRDPSEQRRKDPLQKSSVIKIRRHVETPSPLYLLPRFQRWFGPRLFNFARVFSFSRVRDGDRRSDRSYISRRSWVLRSFQARVTLAANTARSPRRSWSGCSHRRRRAILRRSSPEVASGPAPSTR